MIARKIVQILLFVVIACWVQAAPEATNKTTITSDRLTYDYKRSIAVFEGNVVATDPQMRMSADKLTVIFDKTNDVKSITAVGHVTMKTEDKTANCEKAVYVAKTGEILMTGNAKLTRGSDVVTGEQINFNLNDEKVHFERGTDQQVKLVITPQGGDSKDNLLKMGSGKNGKTPAGRKDTDKD